MKRSSITTRRGDDGATGLLDGSRIPKVDPRPEAYGALDEAAAFIGLARAHCHSGEISGLLLQLQNHLYLINAELACPPESAHLLTRTLQSSDLALIEKQMEPIEAGLQLPPRFVLYGETPVSAYLDVARAVCRRAERCVLALHEHHPLQNPVILPYLNRISDALFILARLEEKQQGVPFRHPES